MSKIKPFIILIIFLTLGCTRQDPSSEARRESALSEEHYQRARAGYEKLLAQSPSEKVYFELGMLYYRHGDFSSAALALRQVTDTPGKKYLAISLCRAGDYTQALEVFSRHDLKDDEYLYYAGLAHEKLNLFEKALSYYRLIKSGPLVKLAAEQINRIEKYQGRVLIKDIAPDIFKRIQDSGNSEDYPQAGGIILLSDESITVNPDGSQDARLHYLIKILNQRGKEQFAEMPIEYDSTYEKVNLILARTIRPDGEVADVGSRHIRDVSKYMNFPLYSNARVFIISFPEIAEGSVIEYEATIHSSERINKDDFMLAYTLQTSEPVSEGTFVLKLPAKRALQIKNRNERYNTFGANLKPVIERSSDFDIYRWDFKNIPQIIPEPAMPAQSEINPVIMLSTFDSWEEIYRWWWKLAEDKMRADKDIREKVRQLTYGKKTLLEKARAIHDFCAREIRYVAVEYGQAGYEPHAAADIFRNKYGDCKDQAILLVTMLKLAGISASPVLIPTRDYFDLDPQQPSALFNHCIASAQIGEETIFMDPTAETCAFQDLPAGDQGRGVLICTDKGFLLAQTPLFPASHNTVRQQTSITLNPDDSITAEKKVRTFGGYDQAQRYWVLYTPPQLFEEALKARIQEFSIGATLKGYQVKNAEDMGKPVELDYSFIGPEYSTAAGPLRLLPQLASVGTGMVSKEQRVYPIDLGNPDRQETLYALRLARNFTLKYLPESVVEDSPWMKISVEYTFNNNTVFFKEQSETKKTSVSQEEYADFKAFYERLAKRLKQRVILEKTK